MTSPRSIRIMFLALLTLAAGRLVLAQNVPQPGFDEYINKALTDWEVPGAAIAIIKDDKIIFARGYGVRELGKDAPVNERTLFAIGSSSKAFTAASLAMLVDEGRIKWDDLVTKHLAGFELYDAYASQQMTVRDLLCHRSGLERGADAMWYGSSFGREEIIRRVRFLKPSWSFRSHFGYQNIMFLTAGQILPAVAHRSWDDFVKEQIFTPLGMKESNTSTNDLKGLDNVATPHSKIENEVKPIPWRNIDNIGPAGSINSNAWEMAQWVRLQLGEGSFEGKRLISSAALKEMHKSHTIIDANFPATLVAQEAHFISYGLGWFLHDYRGRKIVEHGGNIDGMSALVAMVPEEKLGLVVLTNLNGSSLREALMYKIFDIYLKQPEKDWSAEILKIIKACEAQGKEAEKRQIEARVKDTRPSLALEKYVGSYQDEMYGEANVTLQNGKLVAQYGKAVLIDLEHWHFDTFKGKCRDAILGEGMVTFTIDSQGKVAEVKIEGFSKFKRAPEKAKAVAGIALSEAELQKFGGKYAGESLPIEVSIEMVGGKLKAVVPGQPVYTLIPVTPTRFQIEGAPAASSISFETAGGSVTRAKLEQGKAPAIVLLPER